MIYLLASIISSLGILIFFKFFSSLKINNYTAIAINYVIAAVFGLMQYEGTISIETVYSSHWFVYALIMGVFFLAGFLFIAFSTQSAGMAITSVASNLSILLPVGFAILIYHEPVGWKKLTGLTMALIAIFLIFKPSKGERLQLRKMLYPIMLFFIVGTNNTLMKVSERNSAADDHMLFLTVIFGVAFLLSILYFVPARKIKSVNFNSIWGGIVLGLLNYYSTLFMLQALTIYESSLYFPVYNLSYISLAAFIGFLFFKERLRKENWIGIAIAVAAIVFITMESN